MMSMGKKPKHLDAAYQTALITCAMLNLSNANELCDLKFSVNSRMLYR
jgi:hypothetical protein